MKKPTHRATPYPVRKKAAIAYARSRCGDLTTNGKINGVQRWKFSAAGGGPDPIRSWSIPGYREAVARDRGQHLLNLACSFLKIAQREYRGGHWVEGLPPASEILALQAEYLES